MAECKDCIHFCVCSPYTAPNESYPEVDGCKCFRATADVVPKSEVFLASSDAMKMLIECHGYALTHDADIKKEVAREIFEEIERFLYLHFRFCKEEIGNDDTEYIKGRLEMNTQIQSFIAELKKKYTGEKECPKCKHFVGCEKANWARGCEEYKEEQK